MPRFSETAIFVVHLSFAFAVSMFLATNFVRAEVQATQGRVLAETELSLWSQPTAVKSPQCYCLRLSEVVRESE
jgi:hypothetical protein